MKDAQRAKVYRAERKVFSYSGRSNATGASHSFDFKTNVELLNYVDEVAARHGIMVSSKEVRSTPSGYAYALGSKVSFPGHTDPTKPTWAWTAWVVLHELAHVMVDQHFAGHSVPGHGVEFTFFYIHLVAAELGQEAADALRDSLIVEKVDVDYNFKKNRAHWVHHLVNKRSPHSYLYVSTKTSKMVHLIDSDSTVLDNDWNATDVRGNVVSLADVTYITVNKYRTR